MTCWVMFFILSFLLKQTLETNETSCISLPRNHVQDLGSPKKESKETLLGALKDVQMDIRWPLAITSHHKWRDAHDIVNVF